MKSSPHVERETGSEYNYFASRQRDEDDRGIGHIGLTTASTVDKLAERIAELIQEQSRGERFVWVVTQPEDKPVGEFIRKMESSDHAKLSDTLTDLLKE